MEFLEKMMSTPVKAIAVLVAKRGMVEELRIRCWYMSPIFDRL